MPVSTLSFLYTDIEGSTRLWERQPQEMRSAIERHNAILRQAVEGFQGCIFRTAGDAICASFASAPAAVAASIQAQRDLSTEKWGLESPLRVRMALHTGEAEERDGDYIGASLNQVGRLLAACHGGQIVMTLVTKELVRAHLPPGTRLLDLGRYQFRDIVEPERIYQVVIEGLPSDFPPLKSLDERTNNLPVQMSSFIGRERELEEIQKQLNSSRLLTLTGPGGTGKTRLAIQIARSSLDQYPDGAWFVELAPISDPNLIFQAISGVLSIREQPNRPMETVIIEALRSRKLLIVLDNCEHLLGGCARVCDSLLRACPEVKILATSREVIGISGESLFRVPPLTLPEVQAQQGVEKSEAVRLFVERASAIQPGFSITPQNAATIAKICQRLDGIPLAIELAAARIGLFSPEQIAKRLDDRFRLLTGGSRTALPRQQTLEALFDWSYELLSPEEKSFFRRLSVFSGGWTFESAEKVCLEPAESTTSPDALELLSQLINKSLVIVDTKNSQSRYHLLETTRQYAQKKLLEAGEASETRTQHMIYFVNLAREHWPDVQSTGFGWFLSNNSPLYTEVDNIRAAQNWALENDIKTALEFAGSLAFLWAGKSQVMEMRGYVKEVLNRIAELPGFEDELSHENKRMLAYAWLAYATFSENLGQNDEALLACKKAVEYSRRAEDLSALSMAYAFLAETAGLTGDSKLAYESGEESIRIARQLNSKWSLAMTLSSTATYALIPLGDFERARQYANEATQYARELSDPRGQAFLQMLKGVLEFHDHHYDAARGYFNQSLAGFQANGDPYFSNVSRSGLADTARLEGQNELSTELYIETIESWQQLGNFGAVARCLECLAFIAIHQVGELPLDERTQKLIHAAYLFGAAENLRVTNWTFMNPIEQLEYEKESGALKAMEADNGSLAESIERSRDEGKRTELTQIIRKLKGLADS